MKVWFEQNWPEVLTRFRSRERTPNVWVKMSWCCLLLNSRAPGARTRWRNLVYDISKDAPDDSTYCAQTTALCVPFSFFHKKNSYLRTHLFSDFASVATPPPDLHLNQIIVLPFEWTFAQGCVYLRLWENCWITLAKCFFKIAKKSHTQLMK